MTQLRKWLLAGATILAAAACGSGSSQSAVTGPPPPPPWKGTPPGPIGTVGAARLLTQGTFGPTYDEINAAAPQTYDQWFAAQATAPTTLLKPQIAKVDSDRDVPWWTQAVNAPDQLRQRVSFTLSEIFVISTQAAALSGNSSQIVAAYQDMLSQGAFGSFRDLIEAISRSAQMGVYLTYFKNNKEDPASGVHPDENYAREIMQLFTVGLVMLNPDGTPQLDGNGKPIPTYGLPEVENLARVFTGWGSAPIPPHTVSDPNSWLYDYDLNNPMACYPDHHDTGAKTIIGGAVVPAGGDCDADLKITLDTLFNHPNVGPFLGKQLIQRLVTSNPSPAYVGRVASAFADNGRGVRGDLLTVIEAVLTDDEARNAGTAAKLREPILRLTHLYRAFKAADAGDSNIGDYQVVHVYDNFDQEPFDSPTVFNFFRPDYLRPGKLLTAGLVAPEFQISNENTVILTTNQIENSAYQYVDSTGKQHQGPDGYSTGIDPQMVMLKTAAWEPYADDPAGLVDKLGLVLMAGQMPDAMRTTLVNYATPVPTASQRVIDTTYLIVSSPQYAIQR
jgi:uncharacterized protein (DUF1800 family)